MPKTKAKKTLYYQSVGRRKSSVCRVRLLLPEKKELVLKDKTFVRGEFYVNSQKMSEYFSGISAHETYIKPYKLTDSLDRFIVLAKAVGGGKNSQLSAFTLASSRALEKVDKEYRNILKMNGLLKVDARVRERRKAGLAQKARKEKQSPKR